MGWKCHFSRHNFSIIPPAEHNFGLMGDTGKHNTLFFEHNPTDPSEQGTRAPDDNGEVTGRMGNILIFALYY